MFEQVLTELKHTAMAFIWPFYEFLCDGQSRYFWLYCVTGFLIAAWVHQRRSPNSTTSAADILFARENWLSRSAINDYVILVVGTFLRLTILAWAFLSVGPITAAVVNLLGALGVKGEVHNVAAILCGVGLTVALFVVDDAAKWYAHYLGHTVPELWEYHKVHHTAEVLNFATSERFHPVDVVITVLFAGLGVSVVNGIFIALFGHTLTPTTVFGANVFLFATNIFGGVLRHTPMWVSFGPVVERWVISPAMHQIHHSEDPRHYDTNMGVSLAIWDRLAGTLYLARDPSEVKAYGIGQETTDFRSLSIIYFRPFTASYALFKKRLGRLSGALGTARLEEKRS